VIYKRKSGTKKVDEIEPRMSSKAAAKTFNEEDELQQQNE
jgi:hypothetical protein